MVTINRDQGELGEKLNQISHIPFELGIKQKYNIPERYVHRSWRR